MNLDVLMACAASFIVGVLSIGACLYAGWLFCGLFMSDADKKGQNADVFRAFFGVLGLGCCFLLSVLSWVVGVNVLGWFR